MGRLSLLDSHDLKQTGERVERPPTIPQNETTRPTASQTVMRQPFLDRAQAELASGP